MAAGLGFKTFNTGDVLSAADVNGYLMQGVLVFADATARNAAITSPQEGQFAYLKDTNVTTYYTGSSWANLDTTGMTNPMTTTGDTIYSSSGSTPARLGIGTAGQVLTVNSGATAPEWATAASGGGMTSLASGSLSGSSLDLTSISGSYKQLTLFLRDAKCSSAGTEVRMRLNNLSTGIYNAINNYNSNGTAGAVASVTATSFYATYNSIAASTTSVMMIDIFDYVNTTAFKQVQIQYNFTNYASQIENTSVRGACRTTNAIDRITVFPDAGTWNAGTYELFGVK